MPVHIRSQEPSPPTAPTLASPSRKRRDPEARPAQILEAAFAEFGEHGLAGARLDDIAKRADVAKGTIYLYFPNKDDLFRAMVRATTVAALEEAEERLASTPDATATAQLKYVVSGWWAFLRTERFQVVHRLVTAELPQFPDLMQFYADDVVARGRRLIAAIIARGSARGEFRAIDPDVGAGMVSALAISHSLWCARRPFFPSVATRTDDEVCHEIMDFLLHALRPQPPLATLSVTERR
ncbi:MAG: TetR/AcrR family transcriptional regulator [Gemmatimonadaceae bacterium]|nr:TetR/AcrR family transcriptional regulator [Gemmatimonadaceae bacterium]